MQNIQKHPMLSVKEAAAAFGIDERTVREKLSNQEWKGEKKTIGLKEKWFMHRGEFERQLERLGLPKPGDRVSVQGMEDTVFASSSTVDAEVTEQAIQDQSSDNQEIYQADQLQQIVKTITETITQPLMQELAQQRKIIFELQHELAEKDHQLRLLPDLHKKAEEQRQEAQAKHFEVEALRKQIAMLQKPWWKKVFGKTANKLNSIAG